MLRKLCIFLSCCMVCISSQLVVFASEKVGSLNLKLNQADQEAEVEIYQVADYINGEYVLNDTFSNFMNAEEIEEFNQLNSDSVVAKTLEENAKVLLKKAEENSVKSYYKEKVKGECSLKDMPLGLYLVVGKMSDKTKEMVPSLIGVPYWNESHELIFDVVAKAKIGDIPQKPGEDADTATETHYSLYLVLLTLSSFGLFILLGKRKYEA